MAKLTIRGHEINVNEAKDSFDRRAIQYRNNILAILKKLDVPESGINVEVLPYAFKKAAAKAEWQLDGKNLTFEYDSAGKFVDNLFVVQKIIELEVDSILSGKKSKADFIKDFESKNSEFNPNNRQSENSSDRQKFMKATGAHKMIIKDQE